MIFHSPINVVSFFQHLSEILCVKLTADEINDKKQVIWQMSVDQTRHAVSKLADQGTASIMILS